MPNQRVSHTTSSGQEISLVHWPGDGPRALAVHGITGNALTWSNPAAALSPPLDLWAPDLRGRGESAWRGSSSIDHHCADILSLWQGLHLGRAILLGYSLGAWTALKFAAAHPDLVDRLVLVDGGGALPPEQLAEVRAGVGPYQQRIGRVFATPQDYLAFLGEVGVVSPCLDAGTYGWQTELARQEDGWQVKVEPRAVAQDHQSVGSLDVAGLYPAVSCPCLVLRASQGIASDQDRLLPDSAVQTMLESLPDCRVTEIPDTNHFSIMCAPSPVRDQALRDFCLDDSRELSQ